MVFPIPHLNTHFYFKVLCYVVVFQSPVGPHCFYGYILWWPGEVFMNVTANFNVTIIFQSIVNILFHVRCIIKENSSSSCKLFVISYNFGIWYHFFLNYDEGVPLSLCSFLHCISLVPKITITFITKSTFRSKNV